MCLAHGAWTLRTLSVSGKSRPDDGDRAHRPGVGEGMGGRSLPSAPPVNDATRPLTRAGIREFGDRSERLQRGDEKASRR